MEVSRALPSKVIFPVKSDWPRGIEIWRTIALSISADWQPVFRSHELPNGALLYERSKR